MTQFCANYESANHHRYGNREVRQHGSDERDEPR